MKKRLLFVLTLMLIFMFTPIAGHSEAGQKKDQKINIYHALGVGWDPIRKAFEKETGIKLYGISMSSGEVLTRMQAEKGNPTMDVWFGGGDDAFRQAASEGLLEKYESPQAKAIPAKYKDKDNYWTGFSLVVVGFSTNKTRLKEFGYKAPKTWDDIIKPKWKGEIIASNPSISGTAYSIVSGIIELKGETAGWKYLEALDKNINHYTPRGNGPGRKVVAGEFTIGLSPDPPEESFQKGSNIGFVYPEDGTTWWPAPIALLKNAHNLRAAKVFYDWILSGHGQEIVAESVHRTPTKPGVKTPGVIKSVDQIKLLDRDFEWAGRERKRIVKEWMKRFGG